MKGLDKRFLLIRLGFTVAAFAFVALGLVAFTPGFQVPFPGWLILFAVISMPFFFYVAGVKTGLGSWLAGMALLALTVWVQIYVNMRSFSSTVTVPYIGIFLFGLAIDFFALTTEQALSQEKGSGE